MGKLTVKLFGIQDGLQVFENQKLIRLKSKDHNLLIMEDHLPLLGELDGYLEIVGQEQKIFENIQGYYMHRNNTFELLLKEK
ncbi:MAG: hypothetical protein K2P09_02585 [Erysipelotrichales bacterium]|nr:hypothetical protein [Erysipelotrichales bacterium]